MRTVDEHTLTACTTSLCDREKPCSRAASNSAAPQIPAGRLPICNQSRFIRETIRIAVRPISCFFSPSLKCNTNRGRKSTGSIVNPSLALQLHYKMYQLQINHLTPYDY